MKAVNLKTEHLTNPLGIDVANPFLSWNVENCICQSGYEVTAVCDGKVVWSTGKIIGDDMSVVYQGPVSSRDRIEWQVKVWDENDVLGDESEKAFFEYALLGSEDRKAKWINPEIEKIDSDENQPASTLVKEFNLEKTSNARIYATAHGIYVLTINGKTIREKVLAPGTSEYGYHMPYQTYDVTELLQVGENKIEVELGDGWYRGCNGNTGTRNVFGTDVALWLQLEVDKEIVLMTDETWCASQDGPVRFNDIQLGERVDARRQVEHYHKVQVEDFPIDNFMCGNTLPIREKETFEGKLIVTPDGGTVLDFGQNMAGYVSFDIEAHEGEKLRLTFGEYLDAEGNFSDANLATIGRKQELHQVVEYICKEGMNRYHPRFCIFGFQVVKVETEIDITGAEFTACAVYSDMKETAEFECDNELVNQLFKNTVWSQKSNFVDIPTDCPQRERSGWTGDAGVFVETGLTLMDSYPIFAKWLRECRVDQYEDGRIFNISPRRQPKPSFFDRLYDGSAGWGDAMILVPYAMYRAYGDKRILEDNYEMMCRWIDYCQKKARKSRLKNRFQRNPYRNYTIDTGIHYGEWLEAGITMQESMKNIILKGVPEIATAYLAYSSRLLGEIAGILGKEEDVQKYRELSENARAAFRYIELKEGRICSDRQCRYVRPLYMELLNEKEANMAAEDLNDLVVENGYHLNTGFLTTPYLCSVLADHGYVETAYRILLQEDAPGWLYSVKKGATTIWESWEGNTGSTGVASLNHYSKGAVVSWLISGICGIHVLGRQITIRPQVNPLLHHAKAIYDSPVGNIVSEWCILDKKVEYRIVIPANTSAVFLLPDQSEKELMVGENCFCMQAGD